MLITCFSNTAPLILTCALLTHAGCASTQGIDASTNRPLVAGYGVGTFEVGELLYETDFSDTENWNLQIQPKPESPIEPRVFTDHGVLDIYAPERGCTAWLEREFSGPIAVTYRVRCPIETLDDPGIQARDINNFWHASDPTRPLGVFDPDHYTGDFGTYHEMQAYYASSGGGGKNGNRTTRFRRYPRHVNGKDVPHLALNDKDGNPDFLITPGKWHTVQLVAFNGMAQYLFDGKVVYQIRAGDPVRVEDRREGQPRETEAVYTFENFPAYARGHFGFRMVATHHQYTDLKVFRLTEAESR